MNPDEPPSIVTRINQYLTEGGGTDLEQTLFLQANAELIRLHTALREVRLKQTKELEKFKNLSNRGY